MLFKTLDYSSLNLVNIRMQYIIGVFIESVAAIVLIGALREIIICPSYTFVFACARQANSFRITVLCSRWPNQVGGASQI